MILIIKAIVLGIVEGLTEFLPVSSTGHLILINQWITFDPTTTKIFDVVIQLGAILAVVVYFWKDIWPFSNDKSKNHRIFSLWKKVIVAVIPAIVLGAVFGNLVEEKLFNAYIVAAMLIIGGIVLLVVERRKHAGSITSIGEMSFKTAFYIGLIQCISFIPGTSRSASTIIGALLLGATRVLSVEFSFFLAIPTMIAASGYTLLKHIHDIHTSSIIIFAVGFVTAFIVALVSIRFLVRFIKGHDFRIFGYYRIILGVLVLLYFLFV